MTFRGWFVRGYSAGRGVIIVRPEYVAFLPTEPMKHLGTEIAKGVVFSAAGVAPDRCTSASYHNCTGSVSTHPSFSQGGLSCPTFHR
jgi:hypothetical protein